MNAPQKKSSEPTTSNEESQSTTGGRRNQSASLRHAISILISLGEAPSAQPLSLTEIAESQGVHKSTVIRLLAPLVDAGLAQKVGRSGYALGPTTAWLGEAYLARLDLRSVAGPVLRRMSQETNETIHLVVYDPPEVIYIEKIDSKRSVRMHSRVGDRQPIYCTAVGKAYLSALSPDEVGPEIYGSLERRNENTIVDADELLREVARVKARGYAIDDEENELEIRCVGAVIYDHRGKPAAGVSVSGPATRVTTKRTKELGSIVTRSAAEISKLLGHLDGSSTKAVQ